MEVKGHLITSMGLGAPGECKDTHCPVWTSLKRSGGPVRLCVFFSSQFSRMKVFPSREQPAEKTAVTCEGPFVHRPSPQLSDNLIRAPNYREQTSYCLKQTMQDCFKSGKVPQFHSLASRFLQLGLKSFLKPGVFLQMSQGQRNPTTRPNQLCLCVSRKCADLDVTL